MGLYSFHIIQECLFLTHIDLAREEGYFANLRGNLFIIIKTGDD